MMGLWLMIFVVTNLLGNVEQSGDHLFEMAGIAQQKTRLRKGWASWLTSPQLPTRLPRTSWTRTQWDLPGKTFLRTQFTRSSSWRIPLANVLSAGGSQAAWTVMPTNASGTTCTQRLLRLTSCLISAQALRIWSSCSSQLPCQSQQAHLQHLFLRAQLHLPHQHQLHLPEALLRDSDL